MTKNILLTLVISLLAASLGFTSCKNGTNNNTMPADSLLIDSSSIQNPDTNVNHGALADSSWDQAAKTFTPDALTKNDSTSKNLTKTQGKSKISPLSFGNPFRPQELLDGLTKAQKGDLRGAIVDFDRCIVKNVKNFNAYFYKAKALIELKEPQNALPNLNLAIENQPTNPMFYYYRGKLFYDQGNPDKAFTDFDKAVSLKADFPDALNYRGVTREVSGKHAEAIEDYKAAIAANPDYATAYYNKGTSEAALGQYKEALTSFSKCIELDPKKVMSFMNRGNCYVMLKDYPSAITDYTAAIALDPENSDAYYNRGAAYHFSGNKNACNDWQKAQSLGNKRSADMLKEYCK